MCLSHVWQPPLSMGFSRQDTGLGCHFLLQGIFQTQGSNPGLLCLLQWQVGSLTPVPPGKPHKDSQMSLKIIHVVLPPKVFPKCWRKRENTSKLTSYTGEGNDNPVQFSFLENSMDREPVGYSPFQFSCSDVSESCDPMGCSMPGLPFHHQFPELTQTHVHWVREVIQQSHHLSSSSPPAFDVSQHQGVFKASVLRIR